MSESKDYETDVAIVGSGIAGALLSYELAKQGVHVICLEAGPFIDRFETLLAFKNGVDRDFQNCYVNPTYAPRPSGHSGAPYLESVGPNEFNPSYLRGLGGTTWHWAGQAWRFLPQDFSEKTLYGVGRDMPITYDDLEPFYQKAEELIGVAGVSTPLNYYSTPRKQPYPMKPVPFSSIESFVASKIKGLGLELKSAPAARITEGGMDRPPCCGSNNCMPICPIGAQYSASVHLHKALEFTTMQLFHDAVVDQLVSSDHKSIDKIRFRDPKGQEHFVRAKHYILAAGGIEIPKLLLLSNLGTEQVGRNLMDHPLVSVSFVAKQDVFAGRGPMVIGSLLENECGDFRSQRSGFRLNIKNFLNMNDIANHFITAGHTGQQLRTQIDERARRLVGIEVFLGQQPEAHNRVTLSPSRHDSLGIPHPRLDYKVGPWTMASLQPAYEACQKIAEACGYEPGTLVFESESQPAKNRFRSNNHLMGTTIMGTNPEDSATDLMGRVYSGKTGSPMENLFVASSSLIAASGVRNVSLTIAAFALRLADHLNKTFKKET